MSTVAEKLRQSREAQNLTLRQVADAIKIRSDYITALEEGNFDVFSAPVYIRGFVRTYATILKLNVPETMASLDSELAQTEKFRDPPPLTEQPRGIIDYVMLQLSRVDWRKSAIGLAIAVVGLTVLFVSLAFWNRSPAPSKSHIQPGVYQPSSHPAGETLPVPQPPAHR